MHPQRNRYDVIVVGGRVAGSLTATLFARAGLRVLVVERSRFPSTTLSTHFFRGNGLIRILDEVDVLDEVLALGSPRLVCEYLFVGGDAEGQLRPPQDPGRAGYCLSVRRETLDAALLGCATRQDVEVHTATSVTGVLVDDDRVVGVRLGDDTGVAADLVVGADGRRSLVAAEVSAEDLERHDGCRALYYRYVRRMPGPDGGPPRAAEFSLLGDELAYVFPSDEGLTCVGVSVNRPEYELLRHDARDRFEHLMRRHTGIWGRYATAERVGRLYGSGPEPDYVHRAAGPGWALVGDSAMHQDPWSGRGMDSAAVAAELLVDSVLEDGSVAGEAWPEMYERQRDDQLLDTFHDTVSAARDLSLFSA